MHGIPAAQLKGFAKNAEKRGDYYTAADFYAKYCQKKEKDLDARYKVGEMYLLSRDYKNACATFKYLHMTEPALYMLAQYYYGVCLMYLGDYDEAKKMFSQFRKEYKGMSNETYYRKMAQRYIVSCDSAVTIMKTKHDVSIQLLDKTINTAHGEQSPVSVDKNTMYYASFNLDSIKYFSYFDSLHTIPVRQFYKAVKEHERWIGQGRLDEPFNIPYVHSCNGVLSADNKRFYFSVCEKNWQGRLLCALAKSEKDSTGLWQPPHKLPYPVNDPNYTATQPALGINSRKNREVIYFVSDREGTRGGMDIWYTEYDEKNNSFSIPKNCGSKINTPGDEVTPFYDMSTHTLYFSSTFHLGLGGLDIFRSTGELNRFLPPENMALPFNSTYDDLYFIISKNKKDGFFVSNRPGGYALKNPTCCDDIYYYKWNKYIQITVQGKIYDMPDNDIMELFNRKFNLGHTINTEQKYISGIAVRLFLFDEKSGQNFLIASDTTDNTGTYTFSDLRHGKQYFVYVDNYGYFNKKLSFSTKDIKDSKTISLQPVGINYIPNDPLQLDIFYGFGQTDLPAEACTMLDTTIIEIMNMLPNIIVEISSHTDDIGDDAINMAISQIRTENAVKYIISKGISKERLIAKGYGESMPIAPNKNEDGSDNPAGREKNRRTEIKIVGSLRQFYFDDEDSEEENTSTEEWQIIE